MGSTVQPLCHGKALEACARLVDNDCPDYQIVHRAFLRRPVKEVAGPHSKLSPAEGKHYDLLGTIPISPKGAEQEFISPVKIEDGESKEKR
ncbi:hypothetical protein DUI87_15454 [Hirundo rustica rustica]|uniref:Uncharacterized protein n=1 Tax=Hirundo rustica rustica TaxID=333673 RepID=A0A3M0K4A0_HIRRU|nr:hypothetical protein DUI87_15454 [Hirundo rustica rustica]